MKKRKRTARAARNYTSEETDMDEVEQQDAAPAPVDISHTAREVGTSGIAAVRGTIDKSTPVDTDVIVAKLPADAAVFGGGVWVVEAFDGGGALELGTDDDVNTFASVPLDAVGFTPIVLNPAGVPSPVSLGVRGRIDGATGQSTAGKAVYVLMYA